MKMPTRQTRLKNNLLREVNVDFHPMEASRVYKRCVLSRKQFELPLSMDESVKEKKN